MKELTKADFAAEVLKEMEEHEHPCKMMGPVLEELSSEYAGKVKFCKVNVDNEGALAEEYGIISIPSIMLFKNGEIVKTSIGAVPKSKIEEMLKD